MIKTAISLLVLVTLYFLYLAYYKTKVAKDLDKIIARGAMILDVRTIREFNKDHLKNAINIPVGNLKKDTNLLDKNKAIVTYCSHGIRSYNAVNILKNKGFEKVYNGGSMKNLIQFLNKK